MSKFNNMKPLLLTICFVIITAYTCSASECGNDKCITFSGVNGRTMLERGINVFATWQFPLWTKLKIDGFGEGIVLDRPSDTLPSIIDIMFPVEFFEEARSWGKQNKNIKIIK